MDIGKRKTSSSEKKHITTEGWWNWGLSIYKGGPEELRESKEGRSLLQLRSRSNPSSMNRLFFLDTICLIKAAMIPLRISPLLSSSSQDHILGSHWHPALPVRVNVSLSVHSNATNTSSLWLEWQAISLRTFYQQNDNITWLRQEPSLPPALPQPQWKITWRSRPSGQRTWLSGAS